MNPSNVSERIYRKHVVNEAVDRATDFLTRQELFEMTQRNSVADVIGTSIRVGVREAIANEAREKIYVVTRHLAEKATNDAVDGVTRLELRRCSSRDSAYVATAHVTADAIYLITEGGSN